jgi:hypothetical protein
MIESRHGPVISTWLSDEDKAIVNMGPFLPEKKIYGPKLEGRVSKAKLRVAWLEFLGERFEVRDLGDDVREKAYFITFTYRDIPKWGQVENAPGMSRVARALERFGSKLTSIGGRGFFGEEFGKLRDRVHHHGIIVSKYDLVGWQDRVKFGNVNPLQMELLEWKLRNGFYKLSRIPDEFLVKGSTDKRVMLYCLKYTIKEEGRWFMYNMDAQGDKLIGGML